MNRRTLLILVLALAAVFLPGIGQRPAGAQEAITLRIATLAPRGSTWHRVFTAWNNSLGQATGNRLQLRVYAGGSQGDERDVVRKIRIGQLDGASVTSLGLGLVVRPVLVLQAPGLFDTYAQLDHTRTALEPQFRQDFEAAGMTLLGWGEAGQLRFFSNRPIVRPSDLRAVRPWVPRDSSGLTEFLEIVGANGVTLGIPEVLAGLSTGQIDTVLASATAASALQWHTRTTHVSASALGILVGATILSKARYDALPPDLQRALMETSAQAHRTLIQRVRADDDRFYSALVGRHGLIADNTNANEAEWRQVGQQTRARLAGRLYPRELLDRVETLVRQVH